jgi:nicotinate-nucleotide adenylyltransferase
VSQLIETSPRQVSRLGLFGGTFDPVHHGHLHPAARAVAALSLDTLVLIPAASPPHKQGVTVSAFAHRFAMLVLATRAREGWEVSDVELGRPGPSFTIDTLDDMAARIRAESTFLIMGSDSFAQVTTWHRWEELVDRVHLAVLHRPGAWGRELLAAAPAELARRVVLVPSGSRVGIVPTTPTVFAVEHRPVAVSATEVRECLRRGQSARGLLPVEVERHALKYHLYG